MSGYIKELKTTKQTTERNNKALIFSFDAYNGKIGAFLFSGECYNSKHPATVRTMSSAEGIQAEDKRTAPRLDTTTAGQSQSQTRESTETREQKSEEGERSANFLRYMGTPKICPENFLKKYFSLDLEKIKNLWYTKIERERAEKMITLLIPENRGKNKTEIRGFWYSSESKKTYYDYLRAGKGIIKAFYSFFDKIYNFKKLDEIKNNLKQEALFYSDKSTAWIYTDRKNIQELKTVYRAEILKGNFSSLRAGIKKFLALYGGCSVYIKKESYLLESWTK